MPDEPVVEEKPVELKEDKFVYSRDHGKSTKVIAKEIAQEQRKTRESEVKADDSNVPVERKEDKAPASTTPPPDAPDKEEERITHNKKLVEEAADKAAEKATERIKKELERVEESKTLTKEEKQEKVEEVKARWAKEGRTPASYEEIYEEAKKDAVAEAMRLIEEREAAKAKAVEEQTAAEKARTEARQKEEDEYRASVEKMTMDELQEMEAEGIKLSDDEKKALFQKGLEVNTDRLAKGLPPIISISRIYYNHYKPGAAKAKQPAGADAPIAGAQTTRPESSRNQGYNYLRDHGKSWRQLITEVVGKK